jgi:hypothetical protein
MGCIYSIDRTAFVCFSVDFILVFSHGEQPAAWIKEAFAICIVLFLFKLFKNSIL